MKIVHKDDVTAKVMQSDDLKNVSIRVMVNEEDGAENFALRVFDVGAGGNTPYHTHGWEHEVYVLSGRGHVKKADGSTVEIVAGTALFIPANEKHSFLASDEGLSFICIIPADKKCCMNSR